MKGFVKLKALTKENLNPCPRVILNVPLEACEISAPKVHLEREKLKREKARLEIAVDKQIWIVPDIINFPNIKKFS